MVSLISNAVNFHLFASGRRTPARLGLPVGLGLDRWLRQDSFDQQSGKLLFINSILCSGVVAPNPAAANMKSRRCSGLALSRQTLIASAAAIQHSRSS